MPYADHDVHLAKMREYAKTPEGKAARHRANKAWRQRNKHKLAAHNAVAKALLSGKIKRQPCEVCGASPAEAHHDDYNKPLEIKWLCDPDHKQRHRELKAAGNQP